MNRNAVRKTADRQSAYVRLPVPLGDREAFRHGATADVLHLLVDNPGRSFTNRELRRVTGRGMSGINSAVDTLEALGVVTVDRSGRANAVRAASGMLFKPDDPVTSVPQSKYHAPIRELLRRLESLIADDIGVVLFGSVARGGADRRSDIDLFVVVDEDRMRTQRAAHRLEQEFADEQFDGDRYEAHIVVETSESAPGHDRIENILAEGLTLRENAALAAVKDEVFGDGA
ncbi:nucleotidyltransferase domain-containing protein [Haloglomus halophilum]|jgi:predicted nucleotidyltransferase|uniref:nucleotidyltransferase domain-containing protein n=1 Tax=Haloglomus halophilum TaxID=2962672 RepID=UPI0020C9C9F6|nr:nucleotidyltransferase domain-containing protein [Haloglomus halophilum]